LPALVGGDCIVPEDADVANALGAVVGQVRVSAEAQISQPVEGLFRVMGPDGIEDFTTEDQALAAAEDRLRAIVARRAVDAGTDEADIQVSTDLKTAEIEGRRAFIEAHMVATASGRPRIAHPEAVS
jgi:N-methylhydantoinase A/oxoprolinase/acetone carboxylase beta subunit